MNLYVGLLHHSVLNKRGKEVVTAVTNLDVHDIARAAKTYGLAGYYLINPLREQQEVVSKIMGHWQSGGGLRYNPDRSDAFELIVLVDRLNDAVDHITLKHGKKPKIIMTTARRFPDQVGYFEVRNQLFVSDDPYLLVLGTGWGIKEELLQTADLVLEPVESSIETGYNHLSVRSAAVVIFDRLLGKERLE